MCKLYYSKDVDHIFPVVESDQSEEHIYVCIKCFRRLEKKYRKLEEIKEIRESINNGFMKVYQCVQLLKGEVSPEASESTPASPRKRSHADVLTTSNSTFKEEAKMCTQYS